ncbi:acyl-CoA dehydratase activase-related protein [Sporomusa malonica]|uniref:Predicted nucleotide-binding protein, sugar kinase/HSP70/actin superfamily n=1 Tax=Sporomusa malonica TaxID=112901 RepID=A0A1W2BSX6_9FIRM|nr:acyl-CoA dehydratase activase-related protein [Sporomusa malonica]SMC75836.1 Predicted nucleotide-binding protein, sugar kinase/HSP70/actin superfamily [Sporomusa malonica]
MAETVRVGLPRGLLYYQYGCLWKNFFEALGAQVVVSGETTKDMLTAGGVLDEVCLPLKVYVGHAASLASKADCLFVPRVVSVARQTYTCPKMMGLPDIIRSSLGGLPEVIDTNVNLRTRNGSLLDAVINTGFRLGQSKISSLGAWYSAWRQVSAKQQAPVMHRVTPAVMLRVGLIGHSYLIQDRFISMSAKDKLTAMGMDVITSDMVPARLAQLAARDLDKQIYWSYCHHLTGSALALINEQAVDGLIFMTSFSCGPDSMISETIKRKAEAGRIPFMLLNLDEHTAEAGLLTRLEAFTDMLKRRNHR